jgi:serine/threonine protein kinase
MCRQDIAARNVLVGENYTGKISDLGLSRMVSGVTESLRNYTNSSIGTPRVPHTNRMLARSLIGCTTDSPSLVAGAVKWMSPESIHSGTYSEKTDAYSFGVFLWEMWTRQQPWDDLPPLQAALQVLHL